MIKLIPEGFLLSDLDADQRALYRKVYEISQRMDISELKKMYEFYTMKLKKNLEYIDLVENRSELKDSETAIHHFRESHNNMILHRYACRRRIEELDVL